MQFKKVEKIYVGNSLLIPKFIYCYYLKTGEVQYYGFGENLFGLVENIMQESIEERLDVRRTGLLNKKPNAIAAGSISDFLDNYSPMGGNEFKALKTLFEKEFKIKS